MLTSLRPATRAQWPSSGTAPHLRRFRTGIRTATTSTIAFGLGISADMKELDEFFDDVVSLSTPGAPTLPSKHPRTPAASLTPPHSPT